MITQEIPCDLEQIKQAYDLKDYPAIEKIAHKIKGGALYLGTTRMIYACQYIECHLKTDEPLLLDRLYRQTVKTITETYDYIKDWLDK